MAVIGGIQPTSPTTTSPAADIFSGMGPDSFLKLLVAQIRYQNPMSPSDPTAMMGQIAQYAQVEALTKLQQGQGVDQSLSEARLATDLVGKVVTASDGSVTQTGKVLSARFTATGPVLVLDSGSEVTLSAVTRVDQTAAVAAAAPIATPTPATPATPATPVTPVTPAPVTPDPVIPTPTPTTIPTTEPPTTPTA
jgi:flagellar basal-body rod modification protein FlgD